MGGKNLRPLTDDQRDRLNDISIHVRRQFERVWGLLPLSAERQDIMMHLMEAENLIHKLRKTPEQMTMEDLENADKTGNQTE